MVSKAPPVLLASGSAYRRDLLARIVTSFACETPGTDEAALPGEAPEKTALRLSILKAEAGARSRPDNIVIGSDQVAALGSRQLGKPGTHQRALRQLLECSGQAVVFYTAVSVAGPGAEPTESCVDKTVVRFRALSEAQIERYLKLEPAFDCAGGFKAEAFGITLFDSIETRDPTAIQGLPLIWLSAALARRGITLP